MQNRVAELRAKWLMSQTELARALGISRQTVSAIENGRWTPSLELAFAISDFFGRDIEEIFLYEKAPAGPENLKNL